MTDSSFDTRVSRRSFIQTVGVSAVGAATTGAVQAAERSRIAERRERGDDVPLLGPDPAPLTLRVNGKDLQAQAEPSTTLLESLRWSLGLTGAKEVCDRGACGACSVLVDGKVINSCMMLVVDAVGREITTIEGLAHGDTLDPLQESFIRHDALQCGFCTPGLIVAGRALLNEIPKPSMEQIRSGLCGNLCRCGTYPNVFNAVLEASGQAVPRDGAHAHASAGGAREVQG